MFRIDWHQLEKNIDAREVSFESFNYQIAVKKYASYGNFKYYYNTPGSEFYLTVNKDCEELSAKKDDVIGWQAKFWLNKSAPDNSPLDANHRNELIDGFKKSLEYKPELNVWIICTPGRFINTAPSYPVDELEKSLKTIKPDINIIYWHKEHYEAIFHSAAEQYASIFNHYFSIQYLGFNLFSRHSSKRLDILRKRYNTDLYTPGKDDKEILSSISYKERLGKLNDRIKHTLEDRKKLVEGHLYKTVISKFLTSTDNNKVTNAQKEQIQKLKSLIDELSDVLEKLHIYNDQEQMLFFIKQLFNIIEDQRESLNNLIRESELDDRQHFNIHIDYNADFDNVYYIINALNSLAWDFLEKTKSIYRLLSHISRQVFYIFGEAGFGKTNFACYITEHLLSKKLPVLLIPASDIRGTGESIEKQIQAFLGIDGSIPFKDFIGILDSLGFTHGIKIPIIIDGLNETQPSASVWHPQLEYISKELATYDNVMLITTCRTAYAKQVFDIDNVDDEPYSLILEGFQENLDEAIKKYFVKYEIMPKNKDFDRTLLKNPLLLSLFSIANRGKTIEINESNIYVAIDSFVVKTIDKIAIKDRRIDPLLKNEVTEGIATFSKVLWEKNSRGIEYKDGLGISPIFDPKHTDKDWTQTVSYKILDEGLLFRNMHEGVEYAEFTYDILGGFCIAKNIVFEGKNREGIIATLTSDDLLKKLTSETLGSRHPLSEDILKSIIFLSPRYTDKELFELIDNTEVVKASISVMRIIISNEKGLHSFIEHFKTLDPEDPVLSHLLENVLMELLRSDVHIGLVELLKAILLRLQMNQLDLNWTEILRRKSDEIIPYLNREIDLIETNKENVESLHQKTLFVSFLLSSTNRFLRGKATLLLVTIGKKYPDLIFEVFLALEGINDLYILERLIAAICGIFLQVENEELLKRACHYLEDNYFKKLRTSHILILDYIDTLINYATIHYGFKRDMSRPSERELIGWQRDIACTKEVTSNEQATWGFGPVDYEFAKYKIGSYLSRDRFEKDSNLPTIKESLAMVVWRAKELGYSDDLFRQLNIQINKESDRYGGRGHVQTYGKKYSKIAFYELFGHNVIKGLSKDIEGKVGYRTSVTGIDPTFPKKLHKRQLITRCFLAKKTEGIQEWIVSDDGVLFEDYYMRSDIEKKEADWVMLYGHLSQKSAEKTRIDISLYTITVPEVKADISVEKIHANELYLPTLITENPYVMAGEIPWSENYRDRQEEREVLLPVSTYSRESKVDLEITNRAYVPSKKIAQSLGLKINLNDFNLYTASNETASSLIQDDYSTFLYMRADLMRQYLMETKQALIWIEMISKYGDYGSHTPKYDPSFEDYRSSRVFTY